METQNNDRKIGVFTYEFVGTSIIMYALMLSRGQFTETVQVVTLAMMLLAWNISGGHFNPAITLGMFIAEKKLKENVVTAAIMIVAQFTGAMFGILLGFLSIVNVQYQKDLAAYESESGSNIETKQYVPVAYQGYIAPNLDYGSDPDFGLDEVNGFTRDWQTFYAMLISSFFLTLAYTSVKSKNTQLTENELLKAFVIYFVLGTVAALNFNFGTAGFNPALATSYIIFEVSQNKEPTIYDSDDFGNDHLNHYLWAYMIGPLVGGALGGIAHLIHSACINKSDDSGASEAESGLD